jgi:hypothetical protein
MSCTHKDEGVKLVYKFEQNKVFQSNKKSSLKLNINKILIPGKNNQLSESSSNILKNDSILRGIREILSKKDLKLLRWNMTTNLKETITTSKVDSANISRQSQLKSFVINADNIKISLDESLQNIIKLIINEEQKRKRKSTGEWYNLPKVLGIDLTAAHDDPYLSQLLLYLKRGFAYPDKEIYNGFKWNSNLHILIPVDSLSKGQSKGFIRIDITNNQELVKTEKNIANIKLDFELLLGWEVNVPEEGFSKCNFSLKGDGFRLFNIKKGWDYGMFLKGDTKIKIDAETIDKGNSNKRIPFILDADGDFGIASKIMV